FRVPMPELIDTVVAHRRPSLLRGPSATAVSNLAAEGISRDVHLVGDAMLDVLNWATQHTETTASGILHRLGLVKKSYLLESVHRSENTDDLTRLSHILGAFNALDEPVVFPVHPRARRIITAAAWRPRPHVHLID